MKKKHLACLIIFLFSSLTACSQNKSVIIKVCNINDNKSDTSQKHICQKMYFQGKILASEIKYAPNGWQIYDSTIYKYADNKNIAMSYRPIYDVENRVLKSYQLEATDTTKDKALFGVLSKIDNSYSLLTPYLYDLSFLLDRKPMKENNSFIFQGEIIPSLFAEFGIPYDEPLRSFNFLIDQNNLIKTDSFNFNNYIVCRKYSYNNAYLLTEVAISVKDLMNKTETNYKEIYNLIK